jgi:alpha-2-macroglobulin
MKTIWSKIKQALVSLFGRVEWNHPDWLAYLKDGDEKHSPSKLTRFLRSFFHHLRALPKRAREQLAVPRNRRIGLATLAVITIGLAVYFLYPRKPEIQKLTYTITPLRATPLEDKATPFRLEIAFDRSAARLQQVDKPITSGITITPPVKGEWRWVSDALLTFTPAQDWPVNAEYTGRFDKSFFPNGMIPDKYEFYFRSAPFQMNIEQTEFYINPTDSTDKRVVATVRFSHPVDTADFEKRIHFTLIRQVVPKAEEDFKFTVHYDDWKGKAFLTSANIPTPRFPSEMTLTIDAGSRSSAGGNRITYPIVGKVHVPGIYDYLQVSHSNITYVANEQYINEQILLIGTNIGVRAEELKKYLQVWLLPVDKPAAPDGPAQKNFEWYDTKIIGPEILAKSQPLSISAVPSEDDYSSENGFRLNAPPGRSVYVRIKKDLPCFGGYLLGNEFADILTVASYPTMVRIMHNGSILSVSGDRKLTVVSTGYKNLNFSLARVLPGEINHLLSQSEGDMHSPNFEHYHFNEENISEIFHQVRDLPHHDPGKPQFTAIDFSSYLSAGQYPVNRGLFILRVDGANPEVDRSHAQAREYGEGEEEGSYQDRRLILLTDLGLIEKRPQSGEHYVFVQSFATGLPVAGAAVSIIGKNGIALFDRPTDSNGMAVFPNLDDFRAEKRPVAYIARLGADISFLPYQNANRRLNYYRFDVGGLQTEGEQGRMSAFLFSDRGIYRPGDTFRIGAIVRIADRALALKNLPVEMVISNPAGAEIFTRTVKLPRSGFVELQSGTEQNSPTGYYTIACYLVEKEKRDIFLGSTKVRVEEFLPDRLRIATHFNAPPTPGWVPPENLSAAVELYNLFGTPAAQRRVTASISLSPAFRTFLGYEDYHFHDPLAPAHSYDQPLDPQQTDQNGLATFPLDFSKFDRASYQVSFAVEGFEAEGGRGVKSESSIMVSPLPYMVGYHSADNLDYVSKGAKRVINFVAIGPDLKKVPVGGIKFSLVEKRFVSVLVRQENGTYKYQSMEKKIVLQEKTGTIPAAGLDYRLSTETPGQFDLVLLGDNDQVINSVEYVVAGEGNLTRELERNAELQIQLSRRDYAPGDEIEVRITAPYTGAGLITIERDRVYASKWFRTSTTSSVQTIKLPEGIEANAYVNVAFIRSLDSPAIYTSPLSYGVAPFSISRKQRELPIKLDAPDLIRPGETLKIGFSTPEPAQIVIFGVDEGILSVAAYRTPDPLAFFLRKRALEVSTTQILDLLLPEFSVVSRLAAIGGGEKQEAIGKNLNPFRRRQQAPVVFWSGILDARAAPAYFKYHIPDYFSGTIRVMAVAVNPEKIGRAQHPVTVHGPFVLTPNLPMFVSPGDSFIASVSVANNLPGSGPEAKLTLRLDTSANLNPTGPKKMELKVSEGREATVRFKLQAGPSPGSAEIKFEVETKGQRASLSSGLSIRPPTPYMVTLNSGLVKDNKIEIAVERKMFPEFRKLEVSLGVLPLALTRGLYNYLRAYPYLCSEQLVSAATADMALRDFPTLGINFNEAGERVNQAIAIMQARQNEDGGFGYWAANSFGSDYLSIYIMQFLTEAEERGFVVPKAVLDKGMILLRKESTIPLTSLGEARTRGFAIYMLARRGELATAPLTELSAYLEKNFKGQWKNDIVAAHLAAAYQLSGNGIEARRIVSRIDISREVPEDYNSFQDGLIRQSVILYLFSRYFPEKLPELDAKLFQEIILRLDRGDFNSFSSANALLALSAYQKAVSGKKGGTSIMSGVTLSEILPNGQIHAIPLRSDLYQVVPFTDQAAKIQIKSSNAFPVYFQITQAGFDSGPPTKELADKLELFREYRNQQGKAVTQVKLGEEVWVHLKLRGKEASSYRNVAIVDLLPGGFEIVLERGSEEGKQRLEAGSTLFSYDNLDLREDRLLVFGTIENRIQEFVYKIRAVAPGEFSVAPAYAESMYDRSIRARGLAGKLVVEENY